MNTGLEVMKGNLQSWSWKDITNIYRMLGEQLKEYQRIKKSVKMEWLNRGFSSISMDAWIFDQIIQRDVRRIDAQLAALDREIARRNQLVGTFQ